ncbi:MAG: hypothetical protein JNG84_05130 [Archangium sp.]|nr:hypothetical protein [Archangium sp.]
MPDAVHSLADAYLDLLDDVPDALRARKSLEDELAALLTGGTHVCIRGFWRIGKTTLLKGVLQRAAERTGGAGFFVDLRDPERDDGVPQTADAVRARLVVKVKEFLTRVGATDVVVSAQRPLDALGELAAPIFVGIDEAIVLQTLGAEPAAALLGEFLSVPKNVRVALACHRHRDADALVESVVLPVTASVDVPGVSDDELVQLVQTPAQVAGVTFENEALGALAEASGNRPWELLTLCHLVASRLPASFKGNVGPDKIDEVLSLDVLAESDPGRAVVDTYLRILATAMSAEERTVMDLLSAGKEGEATEDALARLLASGWISQSDDGGFQVNGVVMDGIARALAEGTIKVSLG